MYAAVSHSQCYCITHMHTHTHTHKNTVDAQIALAVAKKNLQSAASAGPLLGSNVSFDWALYSHRTFLLGVQSALEVNR